MFNIPCIIFAGGKSSRMGEDKSLLPFSTSPTLTEYQLTKLKKIFTNVYISCKNKDKFDFKANYIEDMYETVYAPTAGFLSIYNTLDAEKFFVLSVDSPFISYTEIQNILDNDKDTYDATIARTDIGIQPMCGIYHRSMQAKFEEMYKKNNYKLGYLLKNSNTKYLHFEDETPFTNINHPHEYQKAQKLIAKLHQT